VAKKKTFLTPSKAKKRLAFTKKYKNWNETQWSKVFLWSDECRKVYVKRTKESKYKRSVQKMMKKFGGGTNVKIWGCFGNNNIGKIQFIDGIMTGQIYKEIL